MIHNRSIPICAVEVKKVIASLPSGLDSSDLTEMFLYVKYVYKQHKLSIPSILTDGVCWFGFSNSISDASEMISVHDVTVLRSSIAILEFLCKHLSIVSTTPPLLGI